jgi:hypothetical protein
VFLSCSTQPCATHFKALSSRGCHGGGGEATGTIPRKKNYSKTAK